MDRQIKRSGQVLGVIIPALNESCSIEEVVRMVSRLGLAIVIDDGSTDQTAALARKAGAHVVSHGTNLGYDRALETGLLTACDIGCAFAVTMDADGQHNPELVEIFLKELEGGADLVVGHRDVTQRWSEALFCRVGAVLWGLDDPLCGMKGYRLASICDISEINNYPSVGTELAIRMIKGGARLSQPWVKTRPRAGESRFGCGFKANIRIVNAMINGLLNAPPVRAHGEHRGNSVQHQGKFF